jgi:DNA-binding NarL/FixJ family response regulator
MIGIESMNILYVENHPVFAQSVKQQFLSQHSVTVVPSLSAACQAIPDGAFDLFLVDYDLDDGKGDEFIQALRASGNHTIVIGVSSHDEGNTALMRAGAAAVCSKMQFDRIQTVIDSLLNKKEPNTQPDKPS